VTTPTGLTVALADASRSLTFKADAIEQAQYETAQAGEDLAAAQAAQAAPLVLRSPLFRLSACGQDPISASIAVALPGSAQSDQTYDLYAQDGKAWSWLGAYVDPASGTVSAQVEALPKNVALFQSTSTAPAVSAQVRPGQKLPAGAVDTLTEAFIAGWTLADDGTIVATVNGAQTPAGPNCIRWCKRWKQRQYRIYSPAKSQQGAPGQIKRVLPVRTLPVSPSTTVACPQKIERHLRNLSSNSPSVCIPEQNAGGNPARTSHRSRWCSDTGYGGWPSVTPILPGRLRSGPGQYLNSRPVTLWSIAHTDRSLQIPADHFGGQPCHAR
jgi:hypothetical protein